MNQILFLWVSFLDMFFLFQKKKNNFNILFFVFSIWMVLVILLFFNHEIWRDEIEVWFMAKDLPYKYWIDYSRHIGHPLLFNLILSFFAKIGFPNETLQYVNLFFGTVVGYLILFQSPFRLIVKILILFSAVIVYEFPVIARNYALGVLFIILFLTLLESKNNFLKNYLSWTCLFFATQVHVLFLLLASGFGLLALERIFSSKNKRNLENYYPLLILIIAVVLSWIQLRPPEDPQISLSQSWDNRFLRTLFTTRYMFFPSWSSSKYSIILTLVIIFSTGFFFWRRNQKYLCFAFLFSMLNFFLFFHFVYATGIRHTSIVFICFISYLWYFKIHDILVEKETYDSQIITFLTFISLLSFNIYFIKVSSQDLFLPFSGAKEVSEFLLTKIEKNQNSKLILAGHDPYIAKTVLYYLPSPYEMYFPLFGKSGTHIFSKWKFLPQDNHRNHIEVMSEKMIKDKIYPDYWIINLTESGIYIPQGYKLVFQNSFKKILDPYERFYIISPIENPKEK